MTYAHTAWQEKEPFTADGVAHMDDGNHEERLIIQELLADGFAIVEEQVKLDDDRYFVTGKIDCKILWQGRRVPAELKRMSPYAFDKIETWEDFKQSEFDLKKLRQLTLYLYLHEEEAGLFILSNGIGGRKYIPVPLDYDLAETILTSLDITNAALKSGVLPERIEYRSKICGRCPWRRTCLPDLQFGDGVVLGDAELKDAVTRYLDLKPKVAEFERVKKEIKSTSEGKPLLSVDSYLIEGAWVERKVAAQEARTDRYWKFDIENANDKED